MLLYTTTVHKENYRFLTHFLVQDVEVFWSQQLQISKFCSNILAEGIDEFKMYV
jgi:hypothetical protein